MRSLIQILQMSFMIMHESDDKQLKWYEKSGHVITLGPEKDQLHEDIFEFLESLDWTCENDEK